MKKVQGREKNVLVEHMDQRFDQLERMMVMSLMSNIMSEIDLIENQKNESKVGNSEEKITKVGGSIESELRKNGYHIVRSESFGEKIALYLQADHELGINELRTWMKDVVDGYGQFLFIFLFDKMYGIQRKKLLEERISFMVEGKELYISASGG